MLRDLPEEAALGREAYGVFLKPRVAEMLRTVGLDIAYERAEGDRLWFRDATGAPVEVLDMLGGYGASLLGHNHPELVERATSLLRDKRPFLAQASVRSLAGRLAQRLAEKVGAVTGRSYVVTLGSTGAAAVEIALKHAEMELVERIEAATGRIERTRKAHRIAQAAQSAGARVEADADAELFARAGALLGGPPPRDVDELFAQIATHNAAQFAEPPTFLALERAFHGKSTGALSVTGNPAYRTTWRRLTLRSQFIAPGDVDALERALAEATIRYLDITIAEGGALAVEPRAFSNVAAILCEPIQGEGGIREVSAEFQAALRAAADRAQVPLVFDEIQCGMGRTGTFLASERTSVKADYYLLSKSLGGSLAKISAVLIDRDRYRPEFGLMHTSTFAEDDFASAIALGALDLLERDEGALLRSCVEKGDYLLRALQGVRDRFPGQIRDVRGRGLMIGLELVRQDAAPSTFLRVASEQDMLGYVVAGYLLHEERIRVAPTLSSPETIRLQPSAYVALADLDRLVRAVERLAELLRDGDVRSLTGFLVGRRASTRVPLPATPTTPPARAPRTDTHAQPTASHRRVAFLGHFLEARDVRDWDSAFADLSELECDDLLDRTRRILEPFVADRVTVTSPSGATIDLTVIGVPFTSAQVMASFRAGDAGWARDQVDKAVALAKGDGSTIIGFGGYTSIVTDNCRTVVEDGVSLTTGNSLTAAATVEAVRAAARRAGISEIRLGIVGALGNLGSVIADALAPHVASVLLVGRVEAGARRRLDARAADLLGLAWDRWLEAPAAAGPGDLLDGFVRAAARDAVARLRRDPASLARLVASGSGPGIAFGSQAGLGVHTSSNLDDLASCNVIVTASNAPEPLLRREHLGPAPLVVCDVAAPGDVDPALVAARPDVVFLAGGMVTLPMQQTLRVRGMPLAAGQIYGCLAETVLLGLAGVDESFSLGRLTVDHLARVKALADAHGFRFEEQPLVPAEH